MCTCLYTRDRNTDEELLVGFTSSRQLPETASEYFEPFFLSFLFLVHNSKKSILREMLARLKEKASDVDDVDDDDDDDASSSAAVAVAAADADVDDNNKRNVRRVKE
ncbi:hypothetical protein RUM43_010051 [Polyplax serrata]|uniref:Uncharacterized protein n=1 Tax=Polyplax serrata TaxID=468196 RepID=A0AAN8PVC2_POLSC